MDTAEHHLRRCRQPADLVGLRRAIHVPDSRPEGYVAAGLFERGCDAGDLEGLRGAVVHLRSLGNEAQGDALGVGRIAGAQHGHAIRFKGRHRPFNAVFVCGSGETL